jgi:ribosome-associated translation inhibitor RaiA
MDLLAAIKREERKLERGLRKLQSKVPKLSLNATILSHYVASRSVWSTE